jgi:hypothetical protein
MWLRHTTANEHGPNGSAANAYFQSSPVESLAAGHAFAYNLHGYVPGNAL